MTHAASVFTGYALAAGATVIYIVWVLRRGRTLGRELGIGTTGSRDDSSDGSSPT